MSRYEIVVFDLDGTLIDSDEALVEPFLRLGMQREEITFGHPIEVACAEWGIDLAEYVRLYDTGIVQPFAGVDHVLAQVGRWAVCSNKHPESGHAELARLAWMPEVALFADAFGGAAKRLGPVLEAVGVAPSEVLFVGDTEHDEQCAVDVGCDFAWAGWNPRTAARNPDGTVLSQPMDLLGLIG